jgi:hypothetical protein
VYVNDRDVSSILPVGVGYGKKMHVGITPHPHPVRGKGESRNECGIAVILCVGCFAACHPSQTATAAAAGRIIIIMEHIVKSEEIVLPINETLSSVSRVWMKRFIRSTSSFMRERIEPKMLLFFSFSSSSSSFWFASFNGLPIFSKQKEKGITIK